MSTLPSEIDEEVLAVLGRQSDPDGGEHPYLDHVGRDSFYGFLALHRGELFCDEDFADLYCPYNGHPSIAPSLLATALLLQAYEGVSDTRLWTRPKRDQPSMFPGNSNLWPSQPGNRPNRCWQCRSGQEASCLSSR